MNQFKNTFLQIFFCWILLLPDFAIAQPDTNIDLTNSFWSRHNLAKVGTLGIAGGTLIYSWGVWWKNDYKPFKFFNEETEVFDANLGIDKVGHTYTSYFMFHAVDDILKWGGNDRESAFWWATGISASHALIIEIGDGFSKYGFDWRDLIANWSGVGYSMLQESVPFFKNFQMKWSLYYPLNKHAFKVNDLYDYHIYMMSAKVNELLPAKLEPYWPDFLQVAFGYSGADNVNRREYVFTFDYDLELLPLNGKDFTLLKSLINMFHLPAPGVKFSKGHKPEFSLLLLH
ncbi:MAG: DUF2279 domain-containing protein [Ignavibacteriales bacterium]|nr:DUF2279 domain-containing protein [Ignavibacteriales bacterium]